MMIRILMLVPVISMLLACTLSTGGDAQADTLPGEVGSPTPQAGKRSMPRPIESLDATGNDLTDRIDSLTPQAGVRDVPNPEGESGDESVLVALVEDISHGDLLIEEKILNGDIIVRATVTSHLWKVVANTDGTYSVVLKFQLKVGEYLKGTGSSSIVAIWIDGLYSSTSSEANERKADLVAGRDAQWDDREAIIFLYRRLGEAMAATTVQLQGTNHFFLGVGDRYFGDDRYSLHSESAKVWLPAASSPSANTNQGADPSGDDKVFLLDVPAATKGSAELSSGSTNPTITLGDLKKRISEVATEYDGGDGTAAYKQCVEDAYEFERMIRYFREEHNMAAYDQSPVKSELKSGQPSGTVLHDRYNDGFYPNQKAKTWLEGKDAALFAVVQGTPTAMDVNGDGKFTTGTDGIYFTEIFSTVRPLPAGEYDIDRMEVWSLYLACDFALTNDWTITVTAPSGTLHEMFFDPVTVGTAVAADAANGVLKPRAFTGASGTSATISRIAYEPSSGSGQSGVVKIKVTPNGVLTGQVVDFIGLDGTVSLTLSVAAATADSAAGTLTWPVSTQPWKAGDKLMVRIGPAPPAPAAPAGLTATAGNASVTLAWEDPSNVMNTNNCITSNNSKHLVDIYEFHGAH